MKSLSAFSLIFAGWIVGSIPFRFLAFLLVSRVQVLVAVIFSYKDDQGDEKAKCSKRPIVGVIQGSTIFPLTVSNPSWRPLWLPGNENPNVSRQSHLFL
jgi:hypothetical protein